MAALIVLLTISPALAQRDLTDIPDPDPARELAAFHPAEGFEVNLFAAEPMVRKPIQMNWDSAGRLWVVGSTVYPQIKPGQEPDDKVYILEDTDGDGAADRSTVFAEGLLIPSGVEPDESGEHAAAYVANSTQLLHLADTDGDGRADRRRIVLSGFGTEDTHHILHTFRWGPGGNLYFNQSIYIHSHIETPWGVRRLGGGGIWRLRPRTLRLEVKARGGVNPWGHHFDRWGQSFMTDGAFGEGINYAFPGATFATAVGAERILAGMNPGQPKQCGLEVLSGRALPEAWRGRLLTNDFRGNRVNSFELVESGSGYISRQREHLLAADHVAFRPVDVKMGPDGAIYIADWYNPIIQHGEVDFRDPRRDQEHGRIWRIAAKNRPAVRPPDLPNASVDELLEALKLPEQWTRQRAKRQLQRRGAEAVLPALSSWVRRLEPSDPDYEHHRLEALWVYEWLDAVEPDLLRAVLRSPDPRARAATVRVLSHWIERIDEAPSLLAEAVEDDHPRVRLEAVNALRRLGGAEAASLALRALDREVDEYLDFALWLTARELADAWLPRAQRDPAFFADPRRLIFAVTAVRRPEALAPLMSVWRAGGVPPAHRQRALELIAELGGPAELRMVLDRALDDHTLDPTQRRALLEALHGAARDRDTRPSGDLSDIVHLLDSDSPQTRAAAARLAGQWKVAPARDRLTAFAEGERTDPMTRRAALEALAALGGGPDRDTLVMLTQPPHAIDRRIMAAAALAALDADLAARQAVKLLADAPSDADGSELFDALLRRREGPAALARALGEAPALDPDRADAKIAPEIAAAALRRISRAARDLPELEAALRRAGDLEPIAGMPRGEDLAALIEAVRTEGDAARGETIYRRAALLCANCHAIAGAGGEVGPDLASIGASAQVDYLIESLLDPQAKIKEGYHVTTVFRTDGSVAAGVLVRQTDRALLLRDGADNLLTVPKDRVQRQAATPISLMPPALTAQLRRDELVDLVRFLSELGRTQLYTVPNRRLVRTWRVLEGGEDAGRILRANGVGYAARAGSSLSWRPGYSTVAGELPLGDVPQVWYFAGASFRIVRFEIEAVRPGPVLLRLNTAAGVSMWADGRKIEPVEKQVQLDLPAGMHTITLALDEAQRQVDALRVELAELPGADAQARLVHGK